MLIFMLMLMLMHIVYSVGGQEPKNGVSSRNAVSAAKCLCVMRSEAMLFSLRRETNSELFVCIQC
jgi:hypothetical protein